MQQNRIKQLSISDFFSWQKPTYFLSYFLVYAIIDFVRHKTNTNGLSNKSLVSLDKLVSE